MFLLIRKLKVLEQLCIVTSEVVKNESDQDWNKKGCILIYRILDNIIATYPGLANLIKRGIEKSKAIIAFSKLNLADLNNPDFEISLLETSATKKLEFKTGTTSPSQSSRSHRKRSNSRDINEPTLSDLNHTYISNEKGTNRKASPQ